MAAGPQFAAHPGAMPGHVGIAHGGHPMAQGHPSNQGMPGGGQQPGVTMGQQMQGGIVGPGVPQAGQPGPIMGSMMPTGGPGGVSGNGGPSMHALSHLTPGHPGQVFAQQQQMQQSESIILSMRLCTVVFSRDFCLSPCIYHGHGSIEDGLKGLQTSVRSHLSIHASRHTLIHTTNWSLLPFGKRHSLEKSNTPLSQLYRRYA